MTRLPWATTNVPVHQRVQMCIGIPPSRSTTQPTHHDVVVPWLRFISHMLLRTPSPDAAVGQYGTSLDHAALMTRPMKVHQCLSCGNSLRPSTAHAVPALPLLPQAKDMVRQHAYVPRRSSSAMGIRSASDSLIEVSELPRDMRTAGGIHTSPAKMRQANGRTGSTTTIQVLHRCFDWDGR